MHALCAVHALGGEGGVRAIGHGGLRRSCVGDAAGPPKEPPVAEPVLVRGRGAAFQEPQDGETDVGLAERHPTRHDALHVRECAAPKSNPRVVHVEHVEEEDARDPDGEVDNDDPGEINGKRVGLSRTGTTGGLVLAGGADRRAPQR